MKKTVGEIHCKHQCQSIHFLFVVFVFVVLGLLFNVSWAQTGVYTLNGGNASISGQTYTATNTDESSIYVLNSGHLTLTNCTIVKTGNSSSVDNSSQFGLNAGVLVKTYGTVTINGGKVTTNASGANGLFATNTGSIYMSYGEITASGSGAHGVDVTYAGSITLKNVNVTSTGDNSSTLATDFGGGTVNFSDGIARSASAVSGSHSAGIYSTGVITVSNATVTSVADCGGVIDGANSIILSNTHVYSLVEGFKVWKTAPANGTAIITMTGGSLNVSAGDGFYITGETGNAALGTITVKGGAAINPSTGNIINVISSSSASFTAQGETLIGNMRADATSNVTISLISTSLKGIVTRGALTIDSTSNWNNYGTSTVTSLVNSGTISFGTSSLVLTDIGTFNQTSKGILNILLGSSASFNKIQISGAATLGGTLYVDLDDGYIPNVGDSFTFMTQGSMSGSFAVITSRSGLSYTVNYHSTYINIEITGINQDTSDKAPVISSLPAVKMFRNDAISNIFDLEDYNENYPGTSYTIMTNFLSLGSLSGSSVSQGAYSSGTCGSNTYVVSNLYGSCTVSNKVKYSTYKMRKLPDVALKPGQSESLDITGYCYDTAGVTVAPSFGYPDSILEGDPSWVTGNWDGTTQVMISSQSSFTTGQSHLDLIASTVTTEPFTSDYDVERINVYPDLLSGGVFSSDTDLNAQFGVEGISGLSLPTLGYQSTVTDNGGRELSGVVSFGFTGNTEGVKLTPKIDTMVSCDSGAWYTARIRVFSPNAGNTMEAQVYNFRGIIPSDSVVDLGANILFGVPTTWSWIDIPVYTTATGKGYPQIILKGGSTSGMVYLQSVQYFKGTPVLMDTNRGNHDLNYAYAKPTTMDQLTTGWANGELYGTETPTGVGFSFESSVLVLDYSGASTGNYQKGSKVTAKTASEGVYTGATLPGYQAGMKMQVTKVSGSFNTYNAILLLACYGVQNEGGYDFWSTGGQLIASAQFGDISNGWHYLAAPVRNPWQQFQFITKNDQAGKIQVHEVDFLRDRDDPNLGDGTLF